MSVVYIAPLPPLVPDNGLLRAPVGDRAPTRPDVDVHSPTPPGPGRIARVIELVFVSAAVALFAGLAGAAGYTVVLALTA